MANRYSREYIDGNTVRKNAVPAERPERRQEQKSREQIQRERARRAVARNNRKREQVMNRGYVAFLTAAMAVCFLLCGARLSLQSSITMGLDTIGNLETELDTLKCDNDAQENRIESMMTIESVKARAEQLGMTYPTSEQVEYFTIDSGDYMNQYADLN